MRALFASEMTRLASRRLFRWVLVLFIAALVLASVLVYVNAYGTFSRSNMRNGLVVLSFPLLMFGWLVGASSIGAEWGNRTVSALLTWEPRRTRVLFVKAAGAAVSTGVWALALQVFFTAVMLPVTRGQNELAGAFAWSDYAATAGRALAVAVAGSLVGFALATIGKNTAAALGGGMAYILVAEPLIGVWIEDWSEWLLSPNIYVLVEGVDPSLSGRSAVEAALVLAAYVGVLMLVAWSFFRHREMA